MAEEFDWWNHPKNEVEGRFVSDPYSNIYIGSSPLDGMTKEFAESFDAFVNVSDIPLESLIQHYNAPSLRATYYWYPIAEAHHPWPYGAFYFSKKVLDYHHDRKHKIYFHCVAGLHRSPSMVVFWLYTRGVPIEEAVTLVQDSPETAAELMKTIKDNFDRGVYPDHLMEFMDRMIKFPEGILETYLLKPNPLV